MSAYFVAGTDTEIGKTLVASALLAALARHGVEAVGMKPVAAGAQLHEGVWVNDDVTHLAMASGISLPRELTTPYLLREPAAPHIAAALEGIHIDLLHIVNCYQKVAAQVEAVVVEGVGGFRVPLSATTDTADLARRLNLPVVMVVGLRLGCISQALLTAEAITARGLVLGGWVANSVEVGMPHGAANVNAIAERLSAPLLGFVPRFDDPSPELAAAHIDFSRLPGWPGKHLHSFIH
jgi:dethiobiotin synthetase